MNRNISIANPIRVGDSFLLLFFFLILIFLLDVGRVSTCSIGTLFIFSSVFLSPIMHGAYKVEFYSPYP